jgi:aspartate/methionine/tyrosine aminotransferase
MNPLLEAIAPSLIRALNAKKRPGDIDLGLGEPTLRPAMAPFEAATAWVAEHGCPYTPNAGTLACARRSPPTTPTPASTTPTTSA